MQHHILPEGTLLDKRYRIEALLGEGGFGITYAARDRLGTMVAVKELFWRNHCDRDAAVSPEVTLSSSKDQATFQQRKDHFLREALIMHNLSEQLDIVQVLDFFEENGTAYIVMEYVQGQTLAHFLEGSKPMDAREAFKRFLPLVKSLAEIHKKEVIHRDISPDNIMVLPDGTLKLIDFGAAKEFTIGDDQHSCLIMKQNYAPRELYDEHGDLGPWVDVYSLCATIYTCITGQAPLSAGQRIFVNDLRPPSEIRPEIGPEYEAVLMRGLQLFAEDRYQSMDELGEAMREAMKPRPVPPKPPQWKKLILIVLALCAVAALAALLCRQLGWWPGTGDQGDTGPTSQQVSETDPPQEPETSPSAPAVTATPSPTPTAAPTPTESPTPSPAPTPSPTIPIPVDEPQEHPWIATSAVMPLSFRTGPSTSYADLYTLPVDTEIRAYEREYGNGVAWVLLEYTYQGRPCRAYTGMKRISAAESDVPLAEHMDRDAALARDADVLAAPSSEAGARAALPAGETVRLLEYEGDYALIEFRDGETPNRGYVPRDALAA